MHWCFFFGDALASRKSQDDARERLQVKKKRKKLWQTPANAKLRNWHMRKNEINREHHAQRGTTRVERSPVASAVSEHIYFYKARQRKTCSAPLLRCERVSHFRWHSASACWCVEHTHLHAVRLLSRERARRGRAVRGVSSAPQCCSIIMNRRVYAGAVSPLTWAAAWAAASRGTRPASPGRAAPLPEQSSSPEAAVHAGRPSSAACAASGVRASSPS